MAALIARGCERRSSPRVHPDDTPWKAEAVLRPGVLVRLVNIGPHGALLESSTRLRPGRRAELQLCAQGSNLRTVVVGRIARCQVAGLAPLSFRGAVVFDSESQAVCG